MDVRTNPTFMQHNEAARRFEFEQNGELAHLDYDISNGQIVFVHTEVPKALGAGNWRFIGARRARVCTPGPSAHRVPLPVHDNVHRAPSRVSGFVSSYGIVGVFDLKIRYFASGQNS